MKTKVEVMTVADFVKVTVPTGKIRQEPKPDGHVLLELKAGQELELLERQRRYSRVRYRDHFQDITGWIANVAINLPKGNHESITDDLPSCPFCGSETWLEKGIRTGGNSLLIGNLFSGDYAHSRICLGCGYIQLHISSSALRRIQAEQERQARE